MLRLIPAFALALLSSCGSSLDMCKAECHPDKVSVHHHTTGVKYICKCVTPDGGVYDARTRTRSYEDVSVSDSSPTTAPLEPVSHREQDDS